MNKNNRIPDLTRLQNQVIIIFIIIFLSNRYLLSGETSKSPKHSIAKLSSNLLSILFK